MSSIVHSQTSFSFQSAQGARPLRRAGLLRRLLDKILFEIEVRRSLREVQAFDDKMLRDIGLQRGGIEHALRHGFLDATAESSLRR